MKPSYYDLKIIAKPEEMYVAPEPGTEPGPPELDMLPDPGDDGEPILPDEQPAPVQPPVPVIEPTKH